VTSEQRKQSPKGSRKQTQSSEPAESRNKLHHLLLSVEPAARDHASQPEGKVKDGNYWWYFIRHAKLHPGIAVWSAEQAAAQLADFHRRCCGAETGNVDFGNENFNRLAVRFIQLLLKPQEPEVTSPDDMHAKVKKTWDKIVSKPGESKVQSTLNNMIERGSIEARQLVGVTVGMWGGQMRVNKTETSQIGLVSQHVQGLEREYETVKPENRQKWAQSKLRPQQEQETNNPVVQVVCDIAHLKVGTDNPRRLFGMLLYELATVLRKSEDVANWWSPNQPQLMLGKADVARAFSPYVRVSESTVVDWRNAMAKDKVIRVAKQGGLVHGSRQATEWDFDPIRWMFWWFRESQSQKTPIVSWD
jgi:hypothetical protein